MKTKTTFIFGMLNIVQGVLVGAIPFFVPSRELFVNWLLYAAAVLMLLAGPALIALGRPGAVFATFTCLVHGIMGTVFAALIAASASYLLGIYGHHGQTAGALALVIMAVVLILFWLIPAHELSFLRKQWASK